MEKDKNISARPQNIQIPDTQKVEKALKPKATTSGQGKFPTAKNTPSSKVTPSPKNGKGSN